MGKLTVRLGEESFYFADEHDKYDSLAEETLRKIDMYDAPINMTQVLSKNNFITRRMPLSSDVSGILLVNKSNKILDTDSHQMVVVSDKLDFEEFRFISAHEFGHYVLRETIDSSSDSKQVSQYAHSDNTQISVSEEEKKANTIAICLLMPRQLTIKAWHDLDEDMCIEEKKTRLAEQFQVIPDLVDVRLKMLELA